MLNKKDFENFLDTKESHIEYFIGELKKNGIEGNTLDEYEKKIDEIEYFLKDSFSQYSEQKKYHIRLSFWAFFLHLLMNHLGGSVKLAPKNDYCEGTPQLVDFGFKYDKKGRKKWMAIGVDSWFNGVIEEKLLGSLQDTYNHVIKFYSN
ncbi:MAG: hypothetical protein LBP34_05890 [Flavobacteriaceae bacterium]|jgi:hypothetical protein|nr:hypothetical protein [Flavobacteriaceae bacterium]